MGTLVAAARESVATVGPWLPWCHEGYNRHEAEAWIDTCSRNRRVGLAYEFGLFTEDETTLLGGVAINQINREHNFANLGYWVRQSRQRQGIASRAAMMMAEFGFEELGLTRLEIVVAEGNHASRRLAEQLNATFEAIAQNRFDLA